MMTFSELNINPKIFQSIDACGYKHPTEIQAKTIPLILQKLDVIGATETGSGKTAAFVLPALHLLAEGKKQQKPRVLILTPTRELAQQITQAVRKYGQLIRPSIASIIGGASYRDQERMLSQSPDIIVATPGRLIDHVENKRIDLSAIEMFILDEADRMLDMGFIDDVKLIAKSIQGKKQTLMFTATLNKKLISSVGYLLNDPRVIDLSKPKMVPQQIKQQLFIANNSQQKINFLETLLVEQSVFKGIIFSATKIGADKIANHLRSLGHNALALHGDLKQRVRKKSLEKLTDGKIQYLVATDIAARGINIQDISHVINFDLPRCSDDYIHRVGRTGRAGKPGTAITIATADERRYISLIERHVGIRLQRINQNLEPSTDVYVEEKTQVKSKHPKKTFSREGQRHTYGAKRTESSEKPFRFKERGRDPKKSAASGEEGYSYSRNKPARSGEQGHSYSRKKPTRSDEQGYNSSHRKSSGSDAQGYSYGRKKPTRSDEQGYNSNPRKSSGSDAQGYGYGRKKPAARDDRGNSTRKTLTTQGRKKRPSRDFPTK